MDNREKKQLVRINTFIEKEDYIKLKIKLTIEGKTLTQWLKAKVKEDLGINDK